jgi:hypothetical protein
MTLYRIDGSVLRNRRIGIIRRPPRNSLAGDPNCSSDKRTEIGPAACP